VADTPLADVTGCVLAGGEGRRMQGQDKGLVHYKGAPLAMWALRGVLPHVATTRISANRHQAHYAQLLSQASTEAGLALSQAQALSHVWPDDADLPPFSGPLAGILTALRRAQTDWLLVLPCDTPHLPHDLAQRLYEQATQRHADIAVAQTISASGTHGQPHNDAVQPRPHWVCALVHKRIKAQTEALFMQGERKVGQWVRASRWCGVSFPDNAAFENMNTLETLDGRG
jgi:molybdopterin-guanine dinucleotide biosynthesis protein A